MRRRDFLATTTAAALAPGLVRGNPFAAPQATDLDCCGPTYVSPQAAMKSERETLAFVTAIYVGTGRQIPDYLATVDVDPTSKTYSKVIHRLPMPNVGDELHHFGWNMCSSCHGAAGKSRRYLIVPGLATGNIHVLDAIRNPI